MKLKCDGQGHHPKVRIYVPHCIMRLKAKVSPRPLPLALRLAMERLGMRFAKFVRTDRIVEREPMFMEAACGSPCLCYVDTDGYGMLQANEAEPPPADGCINASEASVGETGERPIFSFLAPLRRIAAAVMILLTLLAGASACHKEPDPQPEPTKTITFNWDWGTGLPPRDTLAYYAKQPDVKTIDLHLMPYLSSGWLPKAFNTARDSLQKGFDVSDKIKGSGTIFVSRLNGAQLPDVNSGLTGMAEVDSIWFAMHGFKIERFQGIASSK